MTYWYIEYRLRSGRDTWGMMLAPTRREARRLAREEQPKARKIGVLLLQLPRGRRALRWKAARMPFPLNRKGFDRMMGEAYSEHLALGYLARFAT